jgi:DNA polymerase III epsilon subunit-like protein
MISPYIQQYTPQAVFLKLDCDVMWRGAGEAIPCDMVHGITDEDVQGAPRIAQVLPELLSFMQDHTIIGHSVNFDIEILAMEAERARVPCHLALGRHVDTCRLARHYGLSTNFSLSAMYMHFTANASLPQSHRALADVMTNMEVMPKTASSVFFAT